MSEFGFRMGAPAPKRRSLWHFLIALALVLGLGALGLLRVLSGPEDFTSGTQGDAVTVTVNSGDSLSVIGRTLKDAGVVASVDAFIQASDANTRARYITPGDYKVPTHLPAATAISMLLSGEARDEVKIVIPEGTRASEVYEIVAKKLGMDAGAVREGFLSIDLPPSAAGKIEGYLFPATYGVKRSATASDVAKLMVSRFQQAASELELERRARAEQLSVHDVLVIASLLEQESAPKDFAKVARVVLNRLSQGMPLQFDSTVNYGLGISVLRLSQAQLDKDTAFNTYLHTGLPPTPIDNPGAAAIEAALSPARGSWLYFVTTDPKRKITEFANTYDEFLALKAKFNRNN